MAELTNRNERRKEQRFRLLGDTAPGVRIERTSGPNDEIVEGTLHDISGSGAKIRTSVCLRFNEVVRLVVRFPKASLELDVSAEVRWNRSLDNDWILGCSFHPPISPTVLHELAKRSYIDRRREPRYAVSEKATVSRQLSQEPISVQLCDVSTDGFCMAGEDMIQVDEHIVLHLSVIQDTAVTIPARVRWHLQSGGLHLLGCALDSAQDSAALTKLMCPTHIDGTKRDTSPAKHPTLALVAIGFILGAVIGKSGFDLYRLSHIPESIAATPKAQAVQAIPSRTAIPAIVSDSAKSHSAEQSLPLNGHVANVEPSHPSSDSFSTIPVETQGLSSSIDSLSVEHKKRESDLNHALGGVERPSVRANVKNRGKGSEVGPSPANPLKTVIRNSITDGDIPGNLGSVTDTIRRDDSGSSQMLSGGPENPPDVMKNDTSTMESTASKAHAGSVAESRGKNAVGNVSGPSLDVPAVDSSSPSTRKSSNLVAGPDLLNEAETHEATGQAFDNSALRNTRLANMAFLRGGRAYRQGQFGEAMKALMVAVSHDPSNPLYHYLLAMAQYQANQRSKAEESIKLAIDLERHRPIENWGSKLSRYQGLVRAWVESKRSPTQNAARQP